jgi:4-amino-4-deoxy-L-arabinose transferase-like glycosyltransferase
MAGYGTFGVHDWPARLVPGAAGLGTVLVVFWWGNRTLGLRAGLAGALIVCLSPRFVHQARMVLMDGPLCFWVTASLALGQQALQSGRLAWGQWFLSAVACGLGFLTKGPVALILVAVPFLAYRVLDRRTARPRVRGWLAYLATAVGLSLPWYVAMAWRDPGFLREFFWNHHVLMRFVQPLHPEPAWFYLPVLLLAMLPWTLVLPSLARLLVRRSRPAAQKRPPVLGFLLLSCAWCVLFFSAADCKRFGYILPAVPTLALALGYALDRQLPGNGSISWGFRGWGRRTALPFWATQGVLAGGIAGALFAGHSGLLTPAWCLLVISGAIAGMAWLYSWRLQLTAAASWTLCVGATFALLFVALHALLPDYYRTFSMRSQVRALRDSASHPQAPVLCYPHHWDSISFYLEREDLRSYSRDHLDHLIADLSRRPETLLFVRSGPALDELVQHLPSSLEFVPKGRSRTVTAGLVRERIDWAARRSD